LPGAKRLRGLFRIGLASCLTVSPLVASADGSTMLLGDAYRLALRQSELVRIAAANEAVAQDTADDAYTAYGPSISVSSRATYQNAAQGVSAPGQPSQGVQQPYLWVTQGTWAQPVFRRQAFEQRRAGMYGVEGARHSVQQARQQLMFDVATAFIAVLSARQQITITQSAIRRAETQVQNAAGRVKAGGALPTATLLAQIELNRAQITANTAQGTLRSQESDFERLVGQAPPERLVLPPTPVHEPLSEALRAAPLQRSDLRSLRALTLQAKANVGVAAAKLFWPTLDVNFFGGYVVASTAQGTPQDYRFPIYGLTGLLNVPIFQGGDEWYQLRINKQRVSIAADQEAYLARQISDDVRTAIARLETANKSIEISTEQQKTAQKNYELVSTHYKLGVSTLLEVVTAQQAVFDAESNRALASYEKELATYQLLFAEGKISM
jgi:outer membrane protein TolC